MPARNGKNRTYRVLIVEGRGRNGAALSRHIESGNFPFEHVIARSVAEAEAIMRREPFEAVIADYVLEAGTAMDVLAIPDHPPVIVLADADDIRTAVATMKAGADDYLIKDDGLNYLEVLPLTVENAIKRYQAGLRIRLLESAVIHASDAIIILEARPRDLPGRRILYVNEAFSKMTGYSHDEAICRTMRMLRGPDTGLSELNTIRDALEGFHAVRVELVNYRKDGSKFWVECNIVPVFDESGECIHWVSVQRDITERKKAEEERETLLNKIAAINADLTELNQELETIGAERTMSLMALTVADRIRNPAAVIGGRCRRIFQKEALTDGLRSSIEQIMESADKLERIVSDFENLLRSRRSRFSHEDVNHLVERVLTVIEKDVACRDINLVISLSPGQLRMNMQRDLLRVAVFHAMKNAVEATPRGGTVKIETSGNHCYATITITDSGSGIPEGDLEEVFKPFFSTKEKGFGMGLPLVKQIVTEHLGEISFESCPGRGSSMKMTFPSNWKDNGLCREGPL